MCDEKAPKEDKKFTEEVGSKPESTEETKSTGEEYEGAFGTCKYHCQSSGKCQVDEKIFWDKDGRRSIASSMASCHSLEFDGICKGNRKLKKCLSCREVCDKESPKEDKDFTREFGEVNIDNVLQ